MRILGIDDGPFTRSRGRKCIIVGVLHDNRLSPIDVSIKFATVDGDDATSVVAEIAKELDAELVILDSVTFCGFNFVDGREVRRELGAPVVHIYLYPLEMTDVRRALERASLVDRRLEVIEAHWAEAKRLECRLGGFWYTAWGEPGVDLCSLQVFSRVPLPLQNAHRLARMFAKLLETRV